jgi:hypothetical protein
MDPNSDQPISGRQPGPDRPIIVGFFAALGLSVAGLLWMALRADSPPSVRLVLDIFLQVALGASAVLVAFRALMASPFRISDLLVMVLLLSLAMKVVLDIVTRFSAIGLLHADADTGERFGVTAQICLIVGSLLLAGAAFALRTLHHLNIDRPATRIITLASGMLALPAAAGALAFLVLIVMQLVGNDFHYVPLFAVLWAVSLGVTLFNIANLARLMALRAEVTAHEHLPQK